MFHSTCLFFFAFIVQPESTIFQYKSMLAHLEESIVLCPGGLVSLILVNSGVPGSARRLARALESPPHGGHVASIFSSWSLPRASWSLPGVFWALLEPQDAPKTPTRAAQERPRRPKTRQDGFFEPTWGHVGANMEPCWHQNRIPKVSYAKTA